MDLRAQAAAANAAGEPVPEIANRLGIHPRTVWKWIRQTRGAAATAATKIPPGFQRDQALTALIDLIVHRTTQDPSDENLARLGRLARAVGSLALMPARNQAVDYSEIHERLMRKIAIALEDKGPLPTANQVAPKPD